MADTLILEIKGYIAEKNYEALIDNLEQTLGGKSSQRVLILEGVTVVGVAHANGSIELFKG